MALPDGADNEFLRGQLGLTGALGIALLLKSYRWPIVVTWLLVLFENALLALMPLLIGWAIDALLEDRPWAMLDVALAMGAWVFIAGIRRVYDTRLYGTMRAHMGAELVSRCRSQPISTLNARLQMSRELVDFLEDDVAELFTAIVQVLASVVLLWSFDHRLGLAALSVVIAVVLIYATFHRRFYELNGHLNAQTERQVTVLGRRDPKSLMAHLMKLRGREVRVSDTEAFLYSLIVGVMFAFVLTNLWLASTMPAVTVGALFTILSYSWQLVESGIALPLGLQQCSRLSEIKARLNQPSLTTEPSVEPGCKPHLGL